jgi:hypothetical protein
VTSVCLLLIVGSSRTHDLFLSHFGNILRYGHEPRCFLFINIVSLSHFFYCLYAGDGGNTPDRNVRN